MLCLWVPLGEFLVMHVINRYINCLKLLFWLTAGWACVWVSGVNAATFSSGLANAEWRAQGSIFECTLSHPLAAFGSAAFTRRAGEQEVFRLEQKRLLLPAGEALVQAAQPSWKNDQAPEYLAAVTTVASKNAMRLDEARAQEFQAVLRGGRRLVFVHQAMAAEQSAVRIILEPIGFQEGFNAYRACVANLLPVNFKQVERTAVYFPAEVNSSTAASVLTAAELRKLDLLLRYVKADKRIAHIFIDGHTDSEGIRPENLEVSKARAEMIADYLLEQGLSGAQLTTRWHGERYPIASNKTIQGRAQNRRVTLRLERTNS